MWKIEFITDEKSVILYVAPDAFITTANTELSIKEQTQLFEAQLAKLAFIFYGETKSKEQSVIYLRSYKAKDENLQDVTLHYYKAGDLTTKILWKRIEGQGRQYTNRLLDTKTGNPQKVVDEEEKRPAALIFKMHFDEHNENMLTWTNRLGYEKTPPICAQPVPYVELADESNPAAVANYIKHNIIIALYNAARDFYGLTWTESKGWLDSKSNPDALKQMMLKFNEKFQGIAQISANLRLSDIDYALTSYQAFSLKNDDKSLCLETAVHDLLVRCAPTESFLYVMNIFKNYGPAFHFAKERLNAFNLIGSKRLSAALNLSSEKMLFDSISEPLEENLGLVTNRVPLVKQATHALSYVTLKAVETIGLKDKRKEFVLNPAVYSMKPMATPAPNQVPLSPSQTPLPISPESSLVVVNDMVETGDLRSESPPAANQLSSSSDDEESYDFEKTMRDLDEIDKEAKKELIILEKPPFYKSAKFKRIMTGMAIGFGLAAIAAAIVCVMLFSGGTILAPVAAAGAVAAIGGLVPSIMTVVSGVIAATMIGAALGALFDWFKSGKAPKRQALTASLTAAPDSGPYQESSTAHIERRLSNAKSREDLPDIAPPTPKAPATKPAESPSFLSRITFGFTLSGKANEQTETAPATPKIK